MSYVGSPLGGRDGVTLPLSVRLVDLLRQELEFYRAAYVLLEQQRDSLKFDSEQKSLRICREVERIRDRIQKGQEQISRLKDSDPGLFNALLGDPQIRQVIDEIARLIQESGAVVKENARLARTRKLRIAQELRRLSDGQQWMNKYGLPPRTARFVDQKQ